MKLRNTYSIIIILFLWHNLSQSQITTTAHDGIPPYNGGFHYGVNMGGYDSSSNLNENGQFVPWLDQELAEIATGNPAAGIPGAGVTSIRLAYPDGFAVVNGFNAREEAFNIYNQLGLRDHTVFLNGPDSSHRDFTEYCPGEPSAIFRNLHTPIWDDGANGTPYNDQNFYARYVYEVVSTYGKWVRYWEVWNEPDFTDFRGSTDPAFPGSWWVEDPSPCDLNGAFGIRAPISHYVRMLRITYEIVKTLYPESYVATGGLGYPSFLDAILRNTDNPNNGDVSAEYPLKGGAYFDVVSWHYYPHLDEAFKEWNQSIMDFDYFRYSDAAYDEFIERDRLYESVLESRGYDGVTYPRKLKINTETNLPRVEILSENSAGGNQLQANYNMKVMFASQVVGLDHLHLFHIGESRDIQNVYNVQHQFEVMGLYENLLTQNKNTVTHTPAGIGLKTMSDVLEGYRYDQVKTDQLQLPSNVRGGAFSKVNGETTYMLWARTFRDRSEEASVSYSFPSSVPWTSNSSATLLKREWNHFQTNQTATISFNNVQLNGNPVFLTLNSGGTVSQCDGLTVSVNAQSPTCFGFTNGTIAISASNGVQPYTFLWEDGSGSPLRNNLIEGDYFVTVTDGAGCSVSRAIQLNSPSALGAFIQVQNESIAGLNDGSLLVFPSGGTPPYSYNWSNGVQTQTNQGLGAGTYSLTVYDSKGCPVFKDAIVEADDIGCGTLNLQLFETNLSCFGSNNGTISANAMGGTGTISFQWNTGEITGFIQNLNSGTYQVTATDELGCSKIESTVITSPAQLSLFISPTQPSISGGSDGRASAFVSGGIPPYTYIWSNNQTTPTIENLTAGVYSVTISDVNGCQSQSQTEILNPESDCENLEVSFVFADPRCPETNTGFVSANPINGIAPFQFNWSTGAIQQTIGNLPAGAYFVTITDAALCSVQAAQTLSPKDPITISADITSSTGNNINDGSATLFVNGGTPPYRASWSHGVEGLIVNNLAAGAYDVTVYDFNNCEAFIQIIIESDDNNCLNFTDVLSSSQNIQCANENDGAIILLPQGGQDPFSYNWSNGATTQSISNLFAGSYTVTVTDVNGCFHIRTITIIEPSPLIGAINVDLTGDCGNIANLNAQGAGGTPPYNYDWNTGTSNAAIFNLPGGLYSVTITDVNGCTFTTEFNFLEDNSFPNVGQEVEDITCNGDGDGSINVEILSGQAPYNYTWSNGASSQDIGSLSAGVYDLTVVDANGCDSEHSFIVSEPNPLEIDFDIIHPNTQYDNGSIKANVFGGVVPYTYLWDFGANTEVINNVNIGSYSVTITDANGCTHSEIVDLNVTSTQNIARDNAFKVFPNPTRDFFFVEIPTKESLPKQITILDMHGKVISTNAYTQQGNLLRMDAQNIVSGTYLIRIELEDGYSLGKRIILLNN